MADRHSPSATAWRRRLYPVTPGSRPQPLVASIAAPVEAGRRVVRETSVSGTGLFMSQVIIVAAGATLFVVGLMALVGVDVSAGAFDIPASVTGEEFSTALAVASIVLGAATTSIVLGAVLASLRRRPHL